MSSSLLDARSPFYADSVKAALYALALGDAAGYPLELLSAQEILADYPVESAAELAETVLGQSVTVSDDTQLALYLLDGISEVLEWNNDGAAADELACMWLALLRWYRTTGNTPSDNAPYALDRPLDTLDCMRHRRGPGKATLTALASGEMQMIDKNINPQALGSGALIRSLVLGFLPVEDPATVVGLASRSAALTHGHPEAIISACAAALLMRQALIHRIQGIDSPLLESTKKVMEWLENLDSPALPASDGTTLRALKTALEYRGKNSFPFMSQQEGQLWGTGWLSPDVLGQGLCAALTAEAGKTGSVPDFMTAVGQAVTIDGDSDSVGALCAALLGAAYGTKILPVQMVERIDVLPALELVTANWFKQLGIS